jgi:hypothetical protein
MTVSGLRKEAARGRLVVERIAGKDYTTLANIERMRELCRVEAKAPGCGSAKVGEIKAGEPHIEPYGSSSMDTIKRAQSAAETIVTELKERSRRTSTASTPRRRQRKARVTPVRFQSQTS